MAEEVTPRERQDALLVVMRHRGHLTVTGAWGVGHLLGFYKGGEATKAKDDLNALCQRNQARRTEGFWRHINEPNPIRLRHKHWADYWTPRGGNN